MGTLMIIDGNSILNRAFYGVKPLTNKNGLQTGAVFGMLNIILSQIERIEPDGVVVAFDLKAPTFRHLMYDKYKSNRHGMPDELAAQLPYAKQMLSVKAIKLPVIELPSRPVSMNNTTPKVINTTGKTLDFSTFLVIITDTINSHITLAYCIPTAIAADVCLSAKTIPTQSPQYDRRYIIIQGPKLSFLGLRNGNKNSPAITDLKPQTKSASTSINFIKGAFKLQKRAPRKTSMPPEILKFFIYTSFS